MYDKQALIALVKEKALRFGDFTLASGKKAKYYLDGKQITLDAAGARLIAEGILDLLGSPLPKAVGGMAIGADPITAAIITIAGVRGLELKGILVRKESKGHGTQQYIEGPVKPGDDVVIVEDVVTTGGSSLLAIDRVEAVRSESARRDRDHRSHGRRRPGVRRPRPQVHQPADDSRFGNRAAAGLTSGAGHGALTEETHRWKPRCTAS